ncbi:MAG: PIN domain-containing protein [Candidatus Micrarchaeota archaeon]
MNLDSRTLIDTNVLVYAFDNDSEKREKAIKLLKTYCDAENCIVSSQNLAEFVFVVTGKKVNVELSKAINFVENLAGMVPVLNYSEQEVLRACQIKGEYDVPFFDALLVATMEKAGVSTIVTENEKDFKNIKWLKVINPF